MTKKCKITVMDEVHSYVTGLSKEHHEYLHDKMKQYMEGWRWHPLVKIGRWDGRIPFFHNDGKIYTRLLDRITDFIDRWGYEIEIDDRRRVTTIVDTRIDKDWFRRKEGMPFDVELRPYQVSAINACLENQSGFIIAATGAGKTWMVAGLTDVLATNGIRSIVIVPSGDLVEQTVETLEQGLLDVGVYSGEKKDIDHMVVVATWQALQNNPVIVSGSAYGPLGEQGFTGTGFGAIIVDEAHGAKAKVVGDLINIAGGNIPYRFGFTGTLPKPEIDQMILEGSIGTTLFSITAAELMAMGYLAQLEIQPIEIQEQLEEDFPDYTSEKSFLSGSKPRLELLADLAIAKTAELGNTLILVNSVKQGKALQKLIKDSVFLHGADDTDTRREWYDLFETRDDLIVIATYGIASTGLSIDRIYHLMMIDAGKSFTRTVQSAGRSLRKGGGKTHAYITEIYSNTKWSKKHWNERKKYYLEALYEVLKPIKIKA